MITSYLNHDSRSLILKKVWWFLFLEASRSIIKCKNNVIVWDENKKKHLNHVLFEGLMLFSCLACQEGWHLFIIFKFHVVPLFIMTVFHFKLTKVSWNGNYCIIMANMGNLKPQNSTENDWDSSFERVSITIN